MNSIWITGARGFIGKALAHRLKLSGAFVAGIGTSSSKHEDDEVLLDDWITSEISSSALEYLKSRNGHPATIFHLAGGSSVHQSLKEPVLDFHRTVASTACLVEWIRLHSPNTKLIFASSAAVYGMTGRAGVPEDAELKPASPYGFHKLIAEKQILNYVTNYGVQAVIVRLFSVYGRGLRKQLIWDICCKLMENPKEIKLMGNGTELRDWLCINDCVCLLEKLAVPPWSSGAIYNGATGKGTSVRAVTEMVTKAWGGNTTIKFQGEARRGDPEDLVADINRLKQIDWQPETDLLQGIQDYVRWFQGEKLDRF